jgi:hypothetical protein
MSIYEDREALESGHANRPTPSSLAVPGRLQMGLPPVDRTTPKRHGKRNEPALVVSGRGRVPGNWERIEPEATRGPAHSTPLSSFWRWCARHGGVLVTPVRSATLRLRLAMHRKENNNPDQQRTMPFHLDSSVDQDDIISCVTACLKPGCFAAKREATQLECCLWPMVLFWKRSR